jgi:hypothetical protein
MKTPEDEAFDDLARKQGHWGGGFKAKQAMAADKFIAAEERKVGERYGYVPKLHPSEWMDAQPVQEPVCDKDPQGCWNVRCQLGKQCKNLAQPAQEQWNEDEWRRNNWRCGHGWLRGEQCESCNAPQPPSEWAGIKAILDEYGLQAIDFVADFKAALAQPAQEPVAWIDIDDKGNRSNLKAYSDGSYDEKPLYTAPPQPAQQEALYGMNQDDWKDVVAAIAKVRDGRGIYLGCRPADVFQDWFLALGTAKVKEKNG